MHIITLLIIFLTVFTPNMAFAYAGDTAQCIDVTASYRINSSEQYISWEPVDGTYHYVIYTIDPRTGAFKRLCDTDSAEITVKREEVPYSVEIRSYGLFRETGRSGRINIDNIHSRGAPFCEYIEHELMSGNTEIDVDGYGLEEKDIHRFTGYILNRHPELYLAIFPRRYQGSSGSEIEYIDVLDESYLEKTKQTEEALESIRFTGSDKEKLEKIKNYILKTAKPDYEYHDYAYTAYGAAIEGKAVCQGFSAMLKYLCDINRIKCEIVTNDDLAHAWNIVEIDGRKLKIDITDKATE